MDIENIRLIEKSVLNRLAAKGHENAAAAINVDNSTITNLKDPDKYKINIRSLATLFDFLELKLVDKHKACYLPDEINPIIDMAKKYVVSLDAKKLEWPEE